MKLFKLYSIFWHDWKVSLIVIHLVHKDYRQYLLAEEFNNICQILKLKARSEINNRIYNIFKSYLIGRVILINRCYIIANVYYVNYLRNYY